MEITKETFEAANQRRQAMKARFPAAAAVRYDDHLARVVVSLSSGLAWPGLAFPSQDTQGLEKATPDNWQVGKSVLRGLRYSLPVH